MLISFPPPPDFTSHWRSDFDCPDDDDDDENRVTRTVSRAFFAAGLLQQIMLSQDFFQSSG